MSTPIADELDRAEAEKKKKLADLQDEVYRVWHQK